LTFLLAFKVYSKIEKEVIKQLSHHEKIIESKTKGRGLACQKQYIFRIEIFKIETQYGWLKIAMQPFRMSSDHIDYSILLLLY